MSVARTARRRRKQHANKFRHLALICGKNVQGGRPIYRSRTLLSVADAIMSERRRAMAEAARKKRK